MSNYSYCKIFPHKIFITPYTFLCKTTVLGLLIDHLDKRGFWQEMLPNEIYVPFRVFDLFMFTDLDLKLFTCMCIFIYEYIIYIICHLIS